jgi:hypothetical protein
MCLFASILNQNDLKVLLFTHKAMCNVLLNEILRACKLTTKMRRDAARDEITTLINGLGVLRPQFKGDFFVTIHHKTNPYFAFKYRTASVLK